MFRIKYCREIILKLMYQIDLLGLMDTPLETIFDNNVNFLRSLNDDEKEYIRKIIANIIEKRDTIDESISNNLIGWKLTRLTPIDRNLLRMGISESYFNDQKAVIIDDILRIAKKYSEEESYKIINAILDKVIQ